MRMTKYFSYPHEYCPYCYTKMSSPTKFYCGKCGNMAPSEKVDYTTDYRGLPICKCGGGPMMIRCENEKCRAVKNIIPPTKTAIVVIAGMRSSGKSTYLLDLVNSQSNQTGIIVAPKSSALISWRQKGIKEMRQLRALENTESGKNNFSSVVGLSVSGKQEEITFSLTDRPGEETQELNKMLGLNYLYCADYIILLLDLLNIPGVEGELTEKGIEYSKEAERIPNMTAVDSIITAISTQRGKYGKKVPIFIGISKWDYVEKADMCPPGFSIGCNGPDLSSVLNSKGKFDKHKWKFNSNAIRNFLIMHNEAEIVNKLESYFKDVSFFAFSNFGTVPHVEGAIVNFPIHSPRHIMDPFYRILSDKKVL